MVHILWLALQHGQFSIGRGLPVYLLGGPALYEVLPCGVSMLCSSSLHRLPCRLENNDVASAGSYGMQGVPGLSCQAPKQDMLVV